MLNIFTLTPIILVLHCIFIFFFRRWLGPIGIFYSSIFVFITSLFISANELFKISINGVYYYIDFGKWFFCLDLIDSHLIFCVDNLALISSVLVLTLTTLALWFGIEYMYRDAFINRLIYLLLLFATSVISLFYCYDFFLIIISWECIGLFSFLLVNFYSMRIYTIKAALKTFIFSRLSDMFMFFSFIITILVFNTTDLSLIFIQTPFLSFHYIFLGTLALHFLTIVSFTIALSGVIKAAQFFFHVWLPDAMEAPTPASALIHSSTLVIAGIFLIIRFSLIFEFTIFTNYFLALLGSITLVFGAVSAIFQHDIKKLVAYSTISQIGYLVCGCGFICYNEVLLYLIIHALNKAFLFILVGYIVHFFNGNTDMRQMGGVNLYSFDIVVLLTGVCFNLSGIPYSAGFFGKELLVFQLLRDDFLSTIVRSCWTVSFFFTPIYMFILLFNVIFGFKKGVLSTYKLFWNFDWKINFNQIINLNYLNLFNIYTMKYQFTIFTCRTTVYILSVFWLFFYFSGEFLILLLIDYSTLTPIILKNFFLISETNLMILPSLNSTSLHSIFSFFIFFLILNSFIFLLNLKYSFNYTYNSFAFVLDALLLLLLLYFFTYSTLFFVLCYFILIKLI